MKSLVQTAALAALMVAAGGAFGQSAEAAPFCIRNQILPPQCIYYDAQECAREAQRQGAECSANPAELRLSQGNGEYCVVTSTQVSVCAFADYGTCAQEAARQHGTCTPASQASPQRQPDPYSAVNGQ